MEAAAAAAVVVAVGGVQGEVEVEEGGDLLEAGVVVEVAGDLSVEVEEEEAGNLWAEEEEEEEAGNQLGTDGAGGAADHPSNLSFVPVERANKPDIT